MAPQPSAPVIAVGHIIANREVMALLPKQGGNKRARVRCLACHRERDVYVVNLRQGHGCRSCRAKARVDRDPNRIVYYGGTLAYHTSGLVVQALAWGWYCPNCKAWTGDGKEILEACRACGAARPRRGGGP